VGNNILTDVERATGFETFTGGCIFHLNKLKNNSEFGDLQLQILFGREIQAAAAAALSAICRRNSAYNVTTMCIKQHCRVVRLVHSV
jgi:hypothetical protein